MRKTIEILEKISGLPCYKPNHTTQLTMNVYDIETAMEQYADEAVKNFSLNLSVNGSFSKEQMKDAYKSGRRWFSPKFDKWWKKNFH